jgi:tetratricopeptide (TPR) repeat protein
MRWLRRSVFVSLACALALLGFRNVEHLRLLWAVAVPGNQLPDPVLGNGRLWGAILLWQSKPQQAIVKLENALGRDILQRDRLSTELLFRAYVASGDTTKAAFFASENGVLDRFTISIPSNEVRARATAAQLLAVQSSFVSLANSAIARGEISSATAYATQAIRLTADSRLNSDAIFVLAQSSANLGNWREAVLFARLSANIDPWRGVDDPRLRFLSQTLSAAALKDGCAILLDHAELTLLAFYVDELSAFLDQACRVEVSRRLESQDYGRLKPFLYLALARSEFRVSRTEQGIEYLKLGERVGLSPLWRAVQPNAGFAVEVQGLSPQFAIDSDEISGFDVDLVALRLGLPAHFLIHAQTSGKRRIQSAVLINLAPTLLFGGGHGLDCLKAKCIEHAFYGDVYGASLDSHAIEMVNRPLFPEGRTSDYALTLQSHNVLRTRSGLASYMREAIPNSRMLHASWIASDGGSAYVGRRYWNSKGPVSIDYVVAGYVEGEWSYVSQVSRIPSNVEKFEIWQLNFESLGNVKFGDALVAVLPD